ncbi:MAG: peptide deformylase [Candidatus Neomarinimicrobiota bacterium]
MAVLGVVHYGDPILRKVCNPIIDFSSIKTIINDMFDSMYEAEGIGLAANQVGLDMNLFIIDITHTDESEDTHVFINSTIVDTFGDKEIFQEGCLSLPGIALDVLRPEKVRIKYQTIDEKWHENEYEGLLSRAIQHEVDHLNGIFTVDRVGEIERIKYQAELKALEKSSQNRMTIASKKGFVL